ncbi:MAG: hypothetical protein HY438_01535 [DPANN group archaeon]|nr:hypothetical protein [DPANN group archaeon]
MALPKKADDFFDVFNAIAALKSLDDMQRDAASNHAETMRIAYLARDAGLKAEKAGHLRGFPLESSSGAIQIEITKEQYESGIVPQEVRNILFTELDVVGRSKQEIAYRKCLLGEAFLVIPSRLEQLLVDASLSLPEMALCVENEPPHAGEFLIIDAAHKINSAVKDYGDASWLAKGNEYVVGKKDGNYLFVMRTKIAGEFLAVKTDLEKKTFRIDYVHNKGFTCTSVKFGAKLSDDLKSINVGTAIKILKTHIKSKK